MEADSIYDPCTKYMCEIIIINQSSQKQQLTALYSIPNGSLPLGSSTYSKISSFSLESYSNKSFRIEFYFPKKGNFKHAPTNICKSQLVIAQTPEYDIVMTPKNVDQTVG